jgi:hypothetical protein
MISKNQKTFARERLFLTADSSRSMTITIHEWTNRKRLVNEPKMDFGWQACSQ